MHGSMSIWTWPARRTGMAPIAPDTVNSSTYQGVGFTGSFDGNGHAIINLTIDTATGNDYLGLFGYPRQRCGGP